MEVESNSLKIERNSYVEFSYKLTNDKGEMVEHRPEAAPANYVHGYYQLLPAVERKMADLKVGDTLTLTLDPEEAYGKYDEKLIQRVPKGDIPPGEEIVLGQVLTAVNDHGHTINLRVMEITDDELVLDANHPMAGERLTFDIKVTYLRSAKPEEIEKLPVLN